MLRWSRTEIALFLLPLALVPFAIYGNRWKVAVTPKPTPGPRPTPTPRPNLYSNLLGTVVAVSPSPDGKWIYTGSQGGATETKFAKWSAQSGSLVRRFGTLPVGMISGQAMVLSPDGRLLGYGYGGWKGDRVVLFDTSTGKECRQIVGFRSIEGGYSDFALNNDVVAIATQDNVRLFNPKTGALAGVLSHRRADFYPKRLRFSPDGRQLVWIGFPNRDFDSYANGNSSDEIVWFDVQTKKRIGTFSFPQCDLFTVRFSGDGRTLLVWGFRRYWVKSRTNNNVVAAQVKMWAIDARSGHKLWSWNMNDWANDFAVSPNGLLFATSQSFSNNGYVTVREVKTNREVFRVPGSVYGQPAFSPNSRTLYLPHNPMARLEQQKDGLWKLRAVRATW